MSRRNASLSSSPENSECWACNVPVQYFSCILQKMKLALAKHVWCFGLWFMWHIQWFSLNDTSTRGILFHKQFCARINAYRNMETNMWKCFLCFAGAWFQCNGCRVSPRAMEHWHDAVGNVFDCIDNCYGFDQNKPRC